MNKFITTNQSPIFSCNLLQRLDYPTILPFLRLRSRFFWRNVHVVQPFTDNVHAQNGSVDVSRRGYVGVAQKFLHNLQRHTLTQKLGGSEMAKIVR